MKNEGHPKDCCCDACIKHAARAWHEACQSATATWSYLAGLSRDYFLTDAYQEAGRPLHEVSVRLASLLAGKETRHRSSLSDDQYKQKDEAWWQAKDAYQHEVWYLKTTKKREMRLRRNLLKASRELTRSKILRCYLHGGDCGCKECLANLEEAGRHDFSLRHFGGSDLYLIETLKGHALLSESVRFTRMDRIQEAARKNAREEAQAAKKTEARRNRLAVAIGVLLLSLCSIGLALFFLRSKPMDVSPHEGDMPELTATQDLGQTNRICLPGQTFTCACQGASIGIQVCDSDGSGFSACRCPSN